jgi:hypothetical protein
MKTACEFDAVATATEVDVQQGKVDMVVSSEPQSRSDGRDKAHNFVAGASQDLLVHERNEGFVFDHQNSHGSDTYRIVTGGERGQHPNIAEE